MKVFAKYFCFYNGYKRFELLLVFEIHNDSVCQASFRDLVLDLKNATRFIDTNKMTLIKIKEKNCW